MWDFRKVNTPLINNVIMINQNGSKEFSGIIIVLKFSIKRNLGILIWLEDINLSNFSYYSQHGDIKTYKHDIQ